MYIEELVPGINIEDESTEFKGIIEEGDGKEIGWLKTIAAFANTNGGTMYIGVENTSHKIVALDQKKADKISLMINRQISNRISPKINYKIEALPINDKVPSRYVLKISVEKGNTLHIYIHENGLLGIYVRHFGETDIATPEEIREMVMMSEQVPFDRPFTDVSFDKKNFSKMFDYAKEHGISLSKKSLISARFISSEEKLSKGAMLFSDDYNGEKTKVVATLWPGFDKGSSVVLSSEEYSGDLLGSILFALEFVHDHSVNGFKKEGNGRTNLFSYPERSVLEGVVNAIGHRNYFISGSQVEINIFKDRLEITSPGSLLGVRVLKHETDIASIIPRRRNEVICNTLVLLHLMEEKGSGFDKIEEDYKGRDDKYLPFVTAASDYFTLTLPDFTFQNGISTDEGLLPEIYTETSLSGKHDMKVLSYCYDKAHSAKEIAAFLGIAPSTYMRKNIIGKLVSAGYLISDKTESTEKFLANHEKAFEK